MQITAYDLAQRYIGIKELSAKGQDHPQIQFWFSLCGYSLDTPDEVAWCSVFVNGISWTLRLPRSKSAAARSNLLIGTPIALSEARVGFDLIILERGTGKQPGPEVIAAPGHVGFYAGMERDMVLVLGGNQNNEISISRYAAKRVLGVRRLYHDN